MSIEVGVWRIDDELNPIPLSGMDYEQQQQETVAADLSVVAPGLLVVGREVMTPAGAIDILAIDANGSLVVVELKRNRTPREVVAQTLDYGSQVRQMSSEEIAECFIDYQRRFLSVADPRGIDDALREEFTNAPDEFNSSHRLLIVAAEIDPPTERIVQYLREEYGVDINVVVFRAFQDEGRQYLTRAWLAEPDLLSAQSSTRMDSRREWNGEFYVSFGVGLHRRWSDAKEYGFISAGGGEWYIRTLRMLQPGDRVWVSVPGTGYVGVGEVLASAVRYDRFTVDRSGSAVPITEIELEAPRALDEEHGEHFVGVKWLRAVELEEAVRERGFFGNQNTVAQPRSPKWEFTVQRLKDRWKIGAAG